MLIRIYSTEGTVIEQFKVKGLYLAYRIAKKLRRVGLRVRVIGTL